MAKLLKLVLKVLTHIFMISAVSLIIAVLSPAESFSQATFGGIGFYGTILSFYVFLFHALLTIISFIVKLINKQG